MPKHLMIQPHLSVDELEARYRQATDPVERSQFQIIWLLAQDTLTRTVVEVTGYSTNWIQQLARRYNQGGPGALGDRRRQNPGVAPLLPAEQQAILRQVIEGPSPDGGLWTGPKVAAWMAARLGRPVHKQRGWEYLLRLGFSPQHPRPRHQQADPAAQAAFKKTCQAS